MVSCTSSLTRPPSITIKNQYHRFMEFSAILNTMKMYPGGFILDLVVSVWVRVDDFQQQLSSKYPYILMLYVRCSYVRIMPALFRFSSLFLISIVLLFPQFIALPFCNFFHFISIKICICICIFMLWYCKRKKDSCRTKTCKIPPRMKPRACASKINGNCCNALQLILIKSWDVVVVMSFDSTNGSILLELHHINEQRERERHK